MTSIFTNKPFSEYSYKQYGGSCYYFAAINFIDFYFQSQGLLRVDPNTNELDKLSAEYTKDIRLFVNQLKGWCVEQQPKKRKFEDVDACGNVLPEVYTRQFVYNIEDIYNHQFKWMEAQNNNNGFGWTVFASYMEDQKNKKINKERHAKRLKKRREKSSDTGQTCTPEEYVRRRFDNDKMYYMKGCKFYRNLCDVSGGGQEHLIFNWLSLSIFKNVVETLQKNRNFEKNQVWENMLKKLKRMQFVVELHSKTYVDRVIGESRISYYHDLNNKVIKFIEEMESDSYGFNLLNPTPNFKSTLSLIINIRLDIIAVITEIVCKNIAVKTRYDSPEEWDMYRKFLPILTDDNEPPTHEERRAICVDLIEKEFLKRNQVKTMINDVREMEARKYKTIVENLETSLDAFMDVEKKRKIVDSHAVSFHQGYFYNTHNDDRYTPLQFMTRFSADYNICIIKTMKPYETVNGKDIFTNDEKTLLGQLFSVSAASNEAESKSNFNFPRLRL
ncbi:MAG: hypothetical protein CMJ39_00555 [Phycisphaerae bacterium]|nr:hypothetical protein [Phycisphaerae bacterium]